MKRVRNTAYPRVLHVIASLQIGGTERQLVEFIARSSHPRGHFVALFDDPGPLAVRVPNPPIHLGGIRRDVRAIGTNVRTVWNLRRVVRDLRPDLVHAHLGLSEVMAALAVPRGVPLVASRRGRNIGFEEAPWRRLVEGLGHRRVDLMLCNSRYLAEYASRHDLWPPPIEVVHNAVDLALFRAEPMPTIGPLRVAIVGNLHAYKGHGRFLHAFALVAESLRHVEAVVVGDGAQRADLEALAAQLGIAGRVRFVGQVDDPRPYVAGSHVVALTSDHEGFPNALLEAMAMGRPVVATAVGGVPELVRDGVDGFLAPSDPRALAARLLDLLGNAELRARMGREARRRAEGFGWDRVVRQTESVYSRLLDGSRRRR